MAPQWLTIVAFLFIPLTAHAQPIRATGQATLSEFGREGTRTQARARAIRRARVAVMEAARAAVNVAEAQPGIAHVRTYAHAWTGTFSIVAEHDDADAVRVELEAEVDLRQLAQRLSAQDRSESSLLPSLGEIRAPTTCTTDSAQLIAELKHAGVRIDPATRRLDLRCDALGPVPHTLLLAHRVQLELPGGELEAAGFGFDPLSAQAAAVVALADKVLTPQADAYVPAASVNSGGVRLRIEAAHPAARVRRLQQALRALDDVQAVAIDGVDADGAVRVHVQSDLDAEALAELLRPAGSEDAGPAQLSALDFSVTIVGVQSADALTIRFR